MKQKNQRNRKTEPSDATITAILFNARVKCRAFYISAQGVEMVIAVASEFGDDFRKFVYYRIENGRILEREIVNAVEGSLTQLGAQFDSLKVDLLIAGKLSRDMEVGLFDAGINLISGINGESDKVLSAYLNGDLQY